MLLSFLNENFLGFHSQVGSITLLCRSGYVSAHGCKDKTKKPNRQAIQLKRCRIDAKLPFVEQTWQNLDEKERKAFLNDYTADFFNATVGRWDELARKYWRQFWSGF